MKKILVIDDEKNVHYSFKRIFPDLDITSALNAEEALEILSGGMSFSLILSDIKMPGISGLELLQKLKAMKLETPIMIMTAHGTLENAINAVKQGAYDYLIKPFDFQKLKDLVYHALSQKAEEKAKSSAPAEKQREELLIGNSAVMQDIYREIARVAMKDITVLVTGESGTGKELVARAIHHYSDRKNQPFVPVNCGAIPSELMESELFGYEKGAFTGAHKKTLGKFQQAEGGTLFLDEIGELPLNLQVKILRAIQEMEITPLGSEKSIKVNVRLITATNRDLKNEIREGSFREDLYYRLNVIRIHLPPLRERKEDLPDLVRFFIHQINGHHKLKIQGLAPDALDKLLSYDFPGNVRELENIITRASVRCHSDRLEREDIEFDSSEEAYGYKMEKNLESLINLIFEKGIRVDQFLERVMLLTLMKKFDHNQSKTADYLGLNRNTLRKMLKDHSIL